MKICIFTDTIDKKDGGPSRSVPILVKGISEAGCNVTLMTFKTDDMNTHVLDSSHVQIVVLDNKPSHDVIEQAIIEGNYDLVHAQGIWKQKKKKNAKMSRKHANPNKKTPRGALEPW